MFGNLPFNPLAPHQTPTGQPVPLGPDRNIKGRKTSKDSQGNWTDDVEYGMGLDEELATRDKYNAQAEARRLAVLKPFLAGGGGSAPPSGATGNIRYDEQGARDAAFSRAKSQAGATARASMDAMRQYLGAGNLGGAREGQGAMEVMSGAAGSLGAYTNEQLMTDLNRAAEISDRERAAGLTERGQNISAMQSLWRLIADGGSLY